jgi:hypothetical protein
MINWLCNGFHFVSSMFVAPCAASTRYFYSTVSSWTRGRIRQSIIWPVRCATDRLPVNCDRTVTRRKAGFATEFILLYVLRVDEYGSWSFAPRTPSIGVGLETLLIYSSSNSSSSSSCSSVSRTASVNSYLSFPKRLIGSERRSTKIISDN